MKTKLKTRLEITRAIKSAIRSPHAWPGCYPLSILMNDGGALCPSCAGKNWKQVAHDTLKGWRTGWDASGVDVLWEGGNHCDHCNACLDAYPDESAVA